MNTTMNTAMNIVTTDSPGALVVDLRTEPALICLLGVPGVAVLATDELILIGQSKSYLIGAWPSDNHWTSMLDGVVIGRHDTEVEAHAAYLRARGRQLNLKRI